MEENQKHYIQSAFENHTENLQKLISAKAEKVVQLQTVAVEQQSIENKSHFQELKIISESTIEKIARNNATIQNNKSDILNEFDKLISWHKNALIATNYEFERIYTSILEEGQKQTDHIEAITKNGINKNSKAQKKIQKLNKKSNSILSTGIKKILSEMSLNASNLNSFKQYVDVYMTELNNLEEKLINLNDGSMIELRNAFENQYSTISNSLSILNNRQLDVNKTLHENNNKISTTINRLYKEDLLSDALKTEFGKNLDRALKILHFNNSELIKLAGQINAQESSNKELQLVIHNNKLESEKFSQLIKPLKQEIEEKIYYHSKNLYLQLEALLYLSNLVKWDKGLPEFHDWTIAPDFAKFLADYIIKHRPETIVSLGSGSSDIIIGRCLQLAGNGVLYSLEHLDKYYSSTKNMIDYYKLNDTVKLIKAPLNNSYSENGRIWQWYDFFPNGSFEKIDLLIVDGPPGNVQAESRYPAVPKLNKYIKKGSVILLDDGRRDEEKKIAQKWADNYDLELKFINNTKGTFMLTKK